VFCIELPAAGAADVAQVVGWLLACRRGSPALIPGQDTWDLWWTHWHWDRFSSYTSVSPVSIIPPMRPTHSSIYHRRCRMFCSQYFSFLCQYHSTNVPYLFSNLPLMLYQIRSWQRRDINSATCYTCRPHCYHDLRRILLPCISEETVLAGSEKNHEKHQLSHMVIC
jgi:hypothetical protein